MFQPNSARSSASVTAKGTSVRLVLHLSLAATARHSRISKGIWLLSLRLSVRARVRRTVSPRLFIVRMISSIMKAWLKDLLKINKNLLDKCKGGGKINKIF